MEGAKFFKSVGLKKSSPRCIFWLPSVRTSFFQSIAYFTIYQTASNDFQSLQWLLPPKKPILKFEKKTGRAAAPSAAVAAVAAEAAAAAVAAVAAVAAPAKL